MKKSLATHNVLLLLIYFTALTFLFTWLPLVRSLFDGETYAWGTSYFGKSFGGEGLRGDYWLLLVKATVVMLLFYTAFRSGNRLLFYALLLIWYLPLLLDAAYNGIYRPELMRFRGDTLGIDISVAALAPAILGLIVVLILYLLYREKGKHYLIPAWTPRNTMWLFLLSSLLPVQFLLLHFGTPHGLTDKIGVFICIVQCLLLPNIFKSYSLKPSAQDSLSGKMAVG